MSEYCDYCYPVWEGERAGVAKVKLCQKHRMVDELIAAAKGVVELPQAHPVDICTCKYCKAFNKLKDEVAKAEAKP